MIKQVKVVVVPQSVFTADTTVVNCSRSRTTTFYGPLLKLMGIADIVALQFKVLNLNYLQVLLQQKNKNKKFGTRSVAHNCMGEWYLRIYSQPVRQEKILM